MKSKTVKTCCKRIFRLWNYKPARVGQALPNNAPVLGHLSSFMEGRNNPYCQVEPDLHKFRAPLCAGFTLIELLVVVLIIGILAAVALPQYNKAIEKSQTAQALTLLKTLVDAQKAYYLQHGEYAATFDQLDVDIPNLGTPTQTIGDGFFNCAVSSSRIINQDWSVCLNNQYIYVGRLRGQYANKAGFGAFSYPSTKLIGNYNSSGNNEYQEIYPAFGIMCFDKTSGYAYCNKLFNATTQIVSVGPFYFFAMN